MKRFFEALGSLRLAMVLILTGVVLMVAGSRIASMPDNTLVRLNSQNLWQWLGQIGGMTIETVWMTGFVLVFTLLGINTIMCALLRLRALAGGGLRRKSPLQVFVISAPTIVHLLFLLAMGGHLLSAVATTRVAAPLEPGTVLETGSGEVLHVTSVREYTFDASVFGGMTRDIQADVIHIDSAGREVRLRTGFMSPARAGKFRLHHEWRRGAAGRQTMLVAVYDPGLWLLTCSAGMIIVVLALYYPARRIFTARSCSS
jgi:hypothetical protein